MKPAELNELMSFETTKAHQAAVLIEFRGIRGIAIRLGETVAYNWLSGETIVFWEDGEHTVLPDEFELIKHDLFGVR